MPFTKLPEKSQFGDSPLAVVWLVLLGVPVSADWTLAMTKQGLIKNLLLGFLPLLIFVAADSFLEEHFGEAKATQYALLLAIGMGFLQMFYILVKEKRMDKLVLLDTGLVVVFGGVSLLSGNDIFFKLKPALMQLMMVALLGVVAFLKPHLLLTMMGRYMQGVELQEAQLNVMQKSAQGLVILLLLHSVLIAYAALYSSKAVWAFISGPLLYILAGIYFLSLFLIGKLRQRQLPKK